MNTVLVTGSSRGIGRAIVERLAADGYAVVVHCRSERAKADAIAQAIIEKGGSARVLQFDVADRARAKATIEADIEQHGAYYGAVLSAGITRDTAFPAMAEEEWDQVINTNLHGFYNVLHPLIMPMVRRRKPGRIVVISSVSGVMGNRGQVNYSASKAGLIGAAKALAVELASRNITVNCIAPGLIETDMTQTAPVDEALKMIPMQRVGQVHEVAGLASFLMSLDAGYITRQVISVNGGMY
ncbi:MAG TPA: 3-ketoacyl-ACP reductase FabG2 [Cellvibrionaceae bacterium]